MSKFCFKCGSPLPEDTVFCPECGIEQPPVPQIVPSPPSIPQKSSKKLFIILSSVATGVIAIIVALFIIFVNCNDKSNSNKKKEPNKTGSYAEQVPENNDTVNTPNDEETISSESNPQTQNNKPQSDKESTENKKPISNDKTKETVKDKIIAAIDDKIAVMCYGEYDKLSKTAPEEYWEWRETERGESLEDFTERMREIVNSDNFKEYIANHKMTYKIQSITAVNQDKSDIIKDVLHQKYNIPKKDMYEIYLFEGDRYEETIYGEESDKLVGFAINIRGNWYLVNRGEGEYSYNFDFN